VIQQLGQRRAVKVPQKASSRDLELLNFRSTRPWPSKFVYAFAKICNAKAKTLEARADCPPAKPSCEPGAFSSRGSTGPISIVPGCPRECWWLISQIRSKKGFANAKNLLTRFLNPCDLFIEKLRNHPEPSE